MARKETRANITDKLQIGLIPIIMGIITTVITRILIGNNELCISKQEGLELMKIIFDVWGILLGFMITAVSILLTIGENGFIKLLQDTNHMKTIIFSYVTASIELFFALAFSIFILFIKMWNPVVLSIFIGFNISIAIAVAISLIFLFIIVLKMN